MTGNRLVGAFCLGVFVVVAAVWVTNLWRWWRGQRAAGREWSIYDIGDILSDAFTRNGGSNGSDSGDGGWSDSGSDGGGDGGSDSGGC